MGRQESSPSSRTTQRRRVTTATIISVILTTILLCYTRSLSSLHLLNRPSPSIDVDVDKQQPIATMAEAEDTALLASIKHPTLLSSLPPSALPQPGGGPNSPRLIIIGDVHGQLSALDALLAKAGYSSERGDTVVFTGDMINKGPNSGGVVDRAIAMGAYGVRGNHEDKVLRAWAKHKNHKKKKHSKHKHKHGHHSSKAEAEAEGDSIADGEKGEQDVVVVEEEDNTEEEEPLSLTDFADLATASRLTPTHRHWLANLPVILRVGTVSPRYGDVVVVHAGLVPGVPLEKQDAWAVMNMRTLLSSTPVSPLQKHSPHHLEPSEGREGRPWASVWNELEKEKQKKKKGKGDRTTVVYGHDAKTGLKIRRYAFGLDSNCCRGGELTALVFEAADAVSFAAEGDRGYESSSGEEESVRKHGITHRLVSVSCEAAVPDDDDDKGGKKKDKSEDKHKDEGKDQK